MEAFKATLEEVVYADLLVHVVDSAFANYDFQIEVTNKVLAEIGAGDKEKIMAYNKIDLVSEDDVVPQPERKTFLFRQNTASTSTDCSKKSNSTSLKTRSPRVCWSLTRRVR